ncbi:MAG TPA: asparagine synthase (glutamine-hydrolyzing) [Polyangiaceae bacterium]
MCGIAGFLAGDRRAAGDAAAVRRIAERLAHRGPDAQGIHESGPCVLGHRRLSIIDLSPEATQPLLNEDGSLAVVVNGEIYNFAELREELLQKGHTFRSHSDSEVVLHLYEEHGPECIARLDGMFAILLWDGRQQRLLAARDRSGKKPLFYRRLAGGAVAFASEVGALVQAFPDQRPEVDYGAIDEFLTLQYVPTPRTAFKDAFKLPAAHYALFQAGAPLPTPVRYWQKPKGPELTGSADELAEELHRLLARAVKRRLVSDVPLGAFLSGGIDSSTIVALMATQSTQPVKTFSIGFPHADDSEVKFARLVAKRYHTDHHEEIVAPEMTSVVAETVRHHGEPFADSSAVAMYYLSKMTKKHVTVALSGDAGDENFAGYKRYTTARFGHAHDALPEGARAYFRAALSLFGRVFVPHVGRYADQLGEGEGARYVRLVGQFASEDKRGFYLDPMREAASNATVERFERILAESSASSPMGRVADLDWQTYMIDDINVKVDIAAMTHALEVRCPFLDTAVVEFASRLPSKMLMRVRGKWLLRRAVRDLVPAAILHRGKRGFALPLERWMKRDLREMTRDVLLSKRARERGLFDPKYVAELVDELDTMNPPVDRVWTMLILELWFREFVDG